jgi:hypothetical protein
MIVRTYGREYVGVCEYLHGVGVLTCDRLLTMIRDGIGDIKNAAFVCLFFSFFLLGFLR